LLDSLLSSLALVAQVLLSLIEQLLQIWHLNTELLWVISLSMNKLSIS